MHLSPLTPRQSLNKAFLKLKPTRLEIEGFKTQLIDLLDKSNKIESEEFHKNLVANFLRETYYRPAHYINTKGSTDLVVHNGNGPESTVGILIEAKKPTNKSQMVRPDNLNVKAFQELVLYYLRERVGSADRNLEIRHLVITNSYEWFIFDATFFDNEFAQNTSLVKKFLDFQAGRLAGTTTDFFYKEIAAPAIKAIVSEVRFTYFDVRLYETALRNTEKKDDASLVALYKILSPQHLLKLPFANDSNSLHIGFYTELLHIVGLIEKKEGSLRQINRRAEGQRYAGSLIENTIVQLDSFDKLKRVTNVSRFGVTREQQLFGVALELVITWINRILFLKLIEAQLSTYARAGVQKAFLNITSIPGFDALNSVFFQVLGRELSLRDAGVKKRYAHIPYLNSSLFEPTDLEHETVFISSLEGEKLLPITTASVLKNDKGGKLRGNIGALRYLFEFLDAYNFASDVGVGEIQEDNKTLINASVLGLIFEKINGYKDGSFFTPGFVTMHMCREVVRRAVIQRFNTEKGWNCNSIGQLYDLIEDRNEANRIINAVRICDPAVGSGHFLVSALNEVIAIKAELRILQDRGGHRLKEYCVVIDNDELILTDNDGKFFSYNPASLESQRVQEAIFHEKQSIIEGCLFGVDVNPNSVNICRLRLWIELLKNAYYKTNGELETLPNIDINIKCGNSLIARFPINADLAQVLRRKKLRVTDYRKAVRTYQNARSKDEKQEIHTYIEKLKGDFRSEIFDNDPKVRQLSAAQAELAISKNQQVLFQESLSEKKTKRLREAYLESEIKRLLDAIELIKSNRIFKDAFEWRFEFPEVLDDAGGFLGFDLVIGNPPYGVSIKDLERDYLVTTLKKVPDFEIYYWFVNRASQILRAGGILGYIIPNSFLFNVNAARYRLELFDNWRLDEVLDCTNFPVFVDAVVRNAVITFTKSPAQEVLGYRPTSGVNSFADLVSRPLMHLDKSVVESSNQNWGLLFRLPQDVLALVRKLRTLPTVDEHFSASQGYIPYRKSDLVKLHGEKRATAIVSERLWHADHKASKEHLEEIFGRSISKYGFEHSGKFVRYGSHVASFVELKFFNQRRLLIREITNPTIIACIVNKVFVNDPQIIAVIPKTGEYSIDFLWAIFNSKVARFFHFNASPKATKGLFPKILVLDVNNFPLPLNVPDKLKAKVAVLVSEAFAADTSQVVDIERKLDKLVYAMYDLNPAEISLIESSAAG